MLDIVKPTAQRKLDTITIQVGTNDITRYKHDEQHQENCEIDQKIRRYYCLEYREDGNYYD